MLMIKKKKKEREEKKKNNNLQPPDLPKREAPQKRKTATYQNRTSVRKALTRRGKSMSASGA